MARPRVEDRNKHLYGVTVRLTKEQYDTLYSVAKEKEVSISDFVRNSVMLKCREYEYRKRKEINR